MILITSQTRQLSFLVYQNILVINKIKIINWILITNQKVKLNFLPDVFCRSHLAMFYYMNMPTLVVFKQRLRERNY